MRGSRRLRPGILVCLTLVAFLLLTTDTRAEDTDQIRAYGSVRLGAVYRLHTNQGNGLSIDGFSQAYGFSLGVNLNRYVGLELAADLSNTDLSLAGLGKVAEYGMFSVIPGVRLRYPLLDGRLTPYVTGGLGFGNNQFKDRKTPGANLSIEANDTTLMGSIGVGLEYFVANNVTVGAEVKYQISRDHEISIDGHTQKLNLDSLLAQASLRFLFPETPEVQAGPPEYRTDGRFYIAFRYGFSYTPQTDLGGSFKYRPSEDGIGGPVDQLIAFSFGWDFSRYLGIDVAGGGYSPNLAISGLGNVAEYAVFYIVPQLRARWPLLNDRLVPYVLAGVGGNYVEIKDVKPRGFGLRLEGKNFAVTGAFGAGVEYMVARNIALGTEVEYMISRGNTFTVDGQAQNVKIDALLMTAGIRVYFGEGTTTSD